MTERIIPLDDEVFVSSDGGDTIKKIKAESLSIGDMIYCFKIKTLTPSLQGNYEFHQVGKILGEKNIQSTIHSLDFKKTGQKYFFPNNWYLLSDGIKSNKLANKKINSAYIFPHNLNLPIPEPLGFRFIDINKQEQLTPQLAYILGAFAVRPQFYNKDGKTWIVIGTRFQHSSKNIFPKKKLTNFMMVNHYEKLKKIIESIWGSESYYIEQRGTPIRFNNNLPKDFTKDYLLRDRAHSFCGVSFHLPINKEDCGTSFGNPKDESLRQIQFWYSSLKSEILELAPNIIKKSFVLGAFDLICNVDTTNKSFGLDWRDGWSGVFPFHSSIAELMNQILSKNIKLSQYPRFTKTGDRLRGVLLRTNIDEFLMTIGFISSYRFIRGCNLVNIKTRSSNFPYNNLLSIIYGFNLYKLPINKLFGSDETDLENRKLFKIGERSYNKKYINIEIADSLTFPVCSLPLGNLKSDKDIYQISVSSKNKLFDRNNFKDEILEFVYHLGNYFKLEDGIQTDLVFEYLISLLFSKIDNVTESWIVPLAIDQGVDTGCKMLIGQGDLDSINIIVQVKLQSSSVGRRVIDQLRGAIGSISRDEGCLGYVVTNNKFSKSAKNSSSEDFPKIYLIDGSQLVEMLLKYEIGFFKKKKNYYADITFFNELLKIVKETRKNRDKIFLNIEDNLPNVIN